MKERIESARIQVVVVGFEAPGLLERLRSRMHVPFLFARDRDRSAYRAFGLGRAGWIRTYLHPQVIRGYAGMLAAGRVPDLHFGQDRRQLGGDFAIDSAGKIVLARPERGPEDRAAIGRLIDASVRVRAPFAPFEVQRIEQDDASARGREGRLED